jgi:hypothetical protein
MNIVSASAQYTVVIQFKGKRVRQYIKCETYAKARRVINIHRANSSVSYIYYSIPGEDKIDAYDCREPERYV